MATQTIHVYSAGQVGPTRMDPKDPEAVLRYSFDWSDWLESGVTISTRTVTVQSGLTKDSDEISGTGVNVVVSGGTANRDYLAECLITTSDGQTDERSMIIPVRER